MTHTALEELVYRITGNAVSDELSLNTEAGTTKNSGGGMPHQQITSKVAKSARKLAMKMRLMKFLN